MDEDAQQLRDRVDDLEETVDEQQALIQRMMPSRRQVLTGAATVGGFALGAGSASAADTTDGRHAAKFGQYAELEDPGGDTWADVPDSGDIDLKTRGLTNVGSISTDEAVINNLGGRGESNSIQSIPSTTATVIELDAADFEDDTSNIVNVDTTNNKLVAKKSGVKYDTKASCKFTDSIGDGDRFKMTIEVNGIAIAEYDLPSGGGAFPGTALADVKELSAGDEITATVFQGSGSSKDLTADERNSVAATVEG